jgi:hypothetical protein
MAAQCIATAILFCGTVRAMDDLGPTNLQKIAVILKENQEIQRQDQEKRQNNVALAKALLKDCGKIPDTGERAAWKKNIKPWSIRRSVPAARIANNPDHHNPRTIFT